MPQQQRGEPMDKGMSGAAQAHGQQRIASLQAAPRRSAGAGRMTGGAHCWRATPRAGTMALVRAGRNVARRKRMTAGARQEQAAAGAASIANRRAASIPKGEKLTAPASGAWRADVPGRARALCLLGMTDREIAGHFGVTAETFCRWKKAHPELAEAMQGARAIADARVAASLYQRAVGYSMECEDVKMVAGEPQIVRYRKTFPPDVTAQIFWLKNRRPDLWP